MVRDYNLYCSKTETCLFVPIEQVTIFACKSLPEISWNTKVHISPHIEVQDVACKNNHKEGTIHMFSILIN
jgi:hypothetical protein